MQSITFDYNNGLYHGEFIVSERRSWGTEFQTKYTVQFIGSDDNDGITKYKIHLLNEHDPHNPFILNNIDQLDVFLNNQRNSRGRPASSVNIQVGLIEGGTSLVLVIEGVRFVKSLYENVQQNNTNVNSSNVNSSNGSNGSYNSNGSNSNVRNSRKNRGNEVIEVGGDIKNLIDNNTEVISESCMPINSSNANSLSETANYVYDIK